MIVIPMAGLSRRFSDAGYSVPKFMLDLDGVPVFDHAVSSFASCFGVEDFLFVARDLADVSGFITARAAALGLTRYATVVLDHPTAGQAETVEAGLHGIGACAQQSVTIFNIDTFRPGFAFPAAPWFARSDGYLDVFRGSGDNWSFVAPAPDEAEPIVMRTTEKDPISDLCCTGLYHFASAALFFEALADERARPSMNELYVAPIYNHLIRRGRRIHYAEVERADVVFCGTPAEYEALAGPGRAAAG